MTSRSCLAVLAFTLPVVAGPSVALGDMMLALRKTVVTVDVPLAMPVSSPLKDWFGLGTMPSLSVAAPVKPWMLLGLRLRAGFLSNGPAPSDRTMKDPGAGGLGALFVTARLRPLAGQDQPLAAGPWVDVGVGGGLTGSLLRIAGEAGLGWNFDLAGFTVGPTARYLQVVETSNPLDNTDAKILLFGIELALRDPHPKGEPEPASPPPTESVKIQDRDGDGIPDDLDKCPDDPEDKDGFEDDDGCPDPDNDGDGIPDVKDKCPNEPETVNGFQDDDGCPDEGPIVVKKDRIYLKEHLLFDTSRARVKVEGQPALAAVLDLWKQHPEWDHLIVDGHADRHGPDRFNLWLSHMRAERVRNKLIEMGFPPEKLTLRAFGRRGLRVPEETTEADRENRRVEFVIVKKAGAQAKAGTAAHMPTSAESEVPLATAAAAPAQPPETSEPNGPSEPPAAATEAAGQTPSLLAPPPATPLEPPPLEPSEESVP